MNYFVTDLYEIKREIVNFSHYLSEGLPKADIIKKVLKCLDNVVFGNLDDSEIVKKYDRKFKDLGLVKNF